MKPWLVSVLVAVYSATTLGETTQKTLYFPVGIADGQKENAYVKSQGIVEMPMVLYATPLTRESLSNSEANEPTLLLAGKVLESISKRDVNSYQDTLCTGLPDNNDTQPYAYRLFDMMIKEGTEYSIYGYCEMDEMRAFLCSTEDKVDGLGYWFIPIHKGDPPCFNPDACLNNRTIQYLQGLYCHLLSRSSFRAEEFSANPLADQHVIRITIPKGMVNDKSVESGITQKNSPVGPAVLARISPYTSDTPYYAAFEATRSEFVDIMHQASVFVADNDQQKRDSVVEELKKVMMPESFKRFTENLLPKIPLEENQVEYYKSWCAEVIDLFSLPPAYVIHIEPDLILVASEPSYGEHVFLPGTIYRSSHAYIRMRLQSDGKTMITGMSPDKVNSLLREDNYSEAIKPFLDSIKK